MVKEKRTRMPSGMAGLMRYDEELKNALKLKPEWVVGFAIGVVVLELVLRFVG